MKKLHILAFCLVFFTLPFIASADERVGEKFADHCKKSDEFNGFVDIDSMPEAGDTPLVAGDNGGWVALYESSDNETLNLEISGSVDDSIDHIVLCEDEKIVAILPVYKKATTDTLNSFKFTFDLELNGESVTISNEKYYDANGNQSTPTECVVNGSNNINSNNADGLMPFQEIDDSMLGCISKDSDNLLGGISYHEVYATYQSI